jgi:SNF2 family DNA or RNA helicase
MFGTWAKEAGDWLPGCPIHSLGSEAAPLPPPGWRGIVIVSWALLGAHAVGLARIAPSLVIADEAHYATNSEAARSQALADLVDSVPHVLLLTGTPINNCAKELWTLLWMLDSHAWPSPDPFDALDPVEVAGIAGVDPEGAIAKACAAALPGSTPQVPAAFRRKLAQFMCRRLKGDAIPLSELPDKQYRTILVNLSPEQRAEYDYVEQNFEEWLDAALRAKERAGLALGKGSDNRSIEERVDAAMKAEYLAKIGYLRAIVGRAKVRAAVDWIARMVENREPVVVFGEHRAVLDAIGQGLTDRGIAFGQLVGKIDKKTRGETVKAFQGGRLGVILASHAGKEGVTLTRARHVLFVQWFWTSAAQDQGADRIHRIGQTRMATVWRMTCPNTIDERLVNISERKRSLVESIVGSAPVRIVGSTETGGNRPVRARVTPVR